MGGSQVKCRKPVLSFVYKPARPANAHSLIFPTSFPSIDLLFRLLRHSFSSNFFTFFSSTPTFSFSSIYIHLILFVKTGLLDAFTRVLLYSHSRYSCCLTQANTTTTHQDALPHLKRLDWGSRPGCRCSFSSRCLVVSLQLSSDRD